MPIAFFTMTLSEVMSFSHRYPFPNPNPIRIPVKIPYIQQDIIVAIEISQITSGVLSDGFYETSKALITVILFDYENILMFTFEFTTEYNFFKYWFVNLAQYGNDSVYR